MASSLTIGESARISASLSSSQQFKSDMDGGGEVSIGHYAAGIGGEKPLGNKAGLAMRVSYDREEYNFSNAKRFLVQNP